MHFFFLVALFFSQITFILSFYAIKNYTAQCFEKCIFLPQIGTLDFAPFKKWSEIWVIFWGDMQRRDNSTNQKYTSSIYLKNYRSYTKKTWKKWHSHPFQVIYIEISLQIDVWKRYPILIHEWYFAKPNFQSSDCDICKVLKLERKLIIIINQHVAPSGKSLISNISQ